MSEPHHRQTPPGVVSAVAASSQLSDAAIETAVKQPPIIHHESLLDADEGQVTDLFDNSYAIPEQPTTSRKELWSYYLYLNGNNGIGPGLYGIALLQSALTQAGVQPGTGEPCTATSQCVVPWPGGDREVSSVVLIANGLCFTIMSVLFVWLGSAADYGSFGRWLQFGLTVTCWVFSYALVFCRDASQWRAIMALYIISYFTYGSTLVFYSAIFPRLAQSMPSVKKARGDMQEGKLSLHEYERIESLERNHISSVSTAHGFIGYLATLVINLSILIPLQGTPAANKWAHFFAITYFVVLASWWFVFQRKRTGRKMPQGSNYLTIGWKQIGVALKEIRKLPQTFFYLFSFFLLADGVNTTGTLVNIIQNQQVEFSFLQITYLSIALGVSSVLSTFGYWYIQRYFGFRTKQMLLFTSFFCTLIPFWGLLGLWTKRIGFHNYWEFYLFNVGYGLSIAPLAAYAQSMMSELVPPGYESMFFCLFGITNKASAIIGPNVIQAIINSTGNSWTGFPFPFALCLLSSILICFVKVEKGRASSRRYAEERAATKSRRDVD